MSIDYDVVLAVGKQFDDPREAFEFLQANAYFKTKQYEDVCSECSLEDALPNYLNGQCLNCYSGDGFYLGFDVYGDTVEELEDKIHAAAARWARMFPKVTPDIIKTVRIS